jgi:GH15 family glucan-1,4-alpha-glucosidase
MNPVHQPEIRDLAIIGDQKTCALIDKSGTIAWYCPERFDNQAMCSLLLDTEKGGFWAVDTQADYQSRRYQGKSSVLCTEYQVGSARFSLTDWMPYSHEALEGICRLSSPAPHPLTHRLKLRDEYGLEEVHLHRLDDKSVLIRTQAGVFTFISSHSLEIENGLIICTIPAEEEGWCYLATSKVNKGNINLAVIRQSLSVTLENWEERLKMVTFSGDYEEHILNSCRAICLMTHDKTGGIIAAATTSLPEGYGNGRNYDYRYVWLRDAAMIVSAHIRAVGMIDDAIAFLGFLCATRTRHQQERIMPFYNLDMNVVASLQEIPLRGYKGEKPVVTGNFANEQLQLDANANVLLAAKLIYSRTEEKPNWETVRIIADFLAENWRKKDHGIWEEGVKEHFTSSKVIAAKGLEFIAEYADTDEQAAKWRKAAREIREFVAAECLTESGAYAVYAGSQKVDVTAALFPVWLYDKPDSPEMKATIREIEACLKEGELYHRRLEEFDSYQEGVFLAGSLWMAQYYITLEDFGKARRILDAVLCFANDLGYLAEEGDIARGEMLGNFPQTFVHASLLGVIVDLDAAETRYRQGQKAI